MSHKPPDKKSSDNAPRNGFDFWQSHSLKYLEMAFRTDKKERVASVAGYGKRTGECGDTIEMYLQISNGAITQASFDSNGCLNTMACANTVIHMAEGKTVDDAWEIAVEDVIDYLETLPEDGEHCAQLAVGALYKALADYQKKG